MLVLFILFLLIFSYLPYHIYNKVSHYHNMDSLRGPFHVYLAYTEIVKSENEYERTKVIVGEIETVCKGDDKSPGVPICE